MRLQSAPGYVHIICVAENGVNEVRCVCEYAYKANNEVWTKFEKLLWSTFRIKVSRLSYVHTYVCTRIYMHTYAQK